MQVNILPGKAVGKVLAPASKSIAHRLLICAGMSEGESVIRGISHSEDMMATLDCLKALGAKCSRDGDTVTVQGIDFKSAMPNAPLYCRESGSTLRFMLPLALLSGNEAKLCASASLMQRPMSVFWALCKEKGLMYKQDAQSISVKGPLCHGDYTVVGNISSQFISGLLFALPLLGGDSTIHIIPPIESRSYINLTVSALQEFGVSVIWKDDRTLYIRGNQRYKAHDTTVEGDYSNAAFLDAFNLFDGSVTVDGLSESSIQGDKVYKRYFEMLCKGTPAIHIGDCPDLGPILFSVAAAKNGGIFNGTRRLRIKESDRAQAMAQELKKFGSSVTVYDDTVVVYPAAFHAPAEPLLGHNDHRIVMALSVLLTLTGGQVIGAEAVRKSFPDFFEYLEKLNISVKTEE